MSLQEQYVLAKKELEKQLENLKYDTLMERVKEIILRGQEVDRLEGSSVSRIPHYYLLQLIAGNQVTASGHIAELFLKFCRQHDIPVDYDTIGGGDEFNGHWSYPTNFKLKSRNS